MTNKGGGTIDADLLILLIDSRIINLVIHHLNCLLFTMSNNATSSDPLFTSWNIGKLQLKHRIVMAPLTRNRATVPSAAPNDLIAEYYEQRASDGGLLITEVGHLHRHPMISS
jgi:hypothetical protein